MVTSAATWLELMDREYLQKFIPPSGSAIKFAIGDDEALEAARRQLASFAAAGACLFAPIDAATTRVHLVHEVFFAISRSIDWEALAQRWMEALFAEHRYAWPQPGRPASLAQISAANNDVVETLIQHNVD